MTEYRTTAELAELKRRAALGERARTIAAALQTTRNAVIGKCRREGIKLAAVTREEQAAWGRRNVAIRWSRQP